MSILDAFTGGSVKDAAAQNAQAFADLRKKGMEFYDKGLTNSTRSMSRKM